MRVRVVAVCFSGPSMNRFLSDAAVDVGSPTFESPTWDRAKMALCDLAQVSVLSMAVFDREMRYLAASPSWLRTFRLQTGSIEGRSHYELFPELPARWREIHRRALAGEGSRCELDVFVRDDGTSHWLRWSTSPWRDAHGEIGGVVICFDDLTESRRIRASLESAEATIATLFESIAVGVAIVDADAQYVRANPAFEQMLGYPQTELRCMCLGSTLHPDEVDTELSGVHEILHGRLHSRESRVRHRHGLGHEIWIDQLMTAMPASPKSPVQLVVFARDATERQAIEQRLRESDRLASVGMLGAGLGHDLKSVLFAMRCGIDAQDRLAHCHSRDDAEHAALRQVSDGIDYLERLSQGLLAFVAEPDSSEGPSAEATDLAEWWAQSHPLLRRAVPRGVSVEFDLPDDPPRLSIGTAALSQAMLNLVVNAGQAIAAHADPARRRGRVLVCTSPSCHADRLRISVIDDGVGMSDAIRSRAFEAFFSTRTGTGGTGLGLAMVKRLIEAAGGSIEVESEPGHGTSMHVDLPIAADP